MIEKMTKYNFILLAREKEAFLSDLQELGVVDITRREKQLDARSSELFGKISSEKKLIGEIESGTDQTLARMQEKLTELRKDAEELRPYVRDRSIRGMLCGTQTARNALSIIFVLQKT